MEAGIGVAVGTEAPPLTVRTAGERRLSLAELRGQPVVVFFADGLRREAEASLTDFQTRLQSLNAAAIVVSDDRAWCLEPNAAVPRACTPPGEIAARSFGRERAHARGIAVVVLDHEGIVRFTHFSSVNEAARLTDCLAEILQTATRRLCARRFMRVGTKEWMTLALLSSLVLCLCTRRS
jgi:hypothetical protein